VVGGKNLMLVDLTESCRDGRSVWTGGCAAKWLIRQGGGGFKLKIAEVI